METQTARLHGLMAEFESPETLVAAAHRAHTEGYRKLDAYSPFPIEELAEALGIHHNRLPWLVLAGAVCGFLGGFGLQTFVSVVDYPMNIGGRPNFSWPSFIPVTFECTVLGAALAAVFGMLAMNGLPMPYHPVFNVERFIMASRDRFFLCIEQADPKFDRVSTEKFMRGLGAREVSEVEP